MLPNLPAGYMLGPYKIIQQLGQGGMATVYKAYHAAMDRYVAVKVLNFQFVSQPEILARFQHEARLIAKLEHPNILPVYDYGESGGIPFLVMRYLEAGTLKERLSGSPLPLQEIDRIFTQLAEALTYAHENGVIHRDIKPSNAMLDKRGQVFLTDFGIAKMMEGSPEFTATGAITGTPAYMSPEQVQGMKLDPRTDIYSLAILLYEMIGGRVPFEAETPLAVILKQIQEPLPPVTIFKPDVHPAIEAVLLKALSKNREERFPDVSAFLASWKNGFEEASTHQLTLSSQPTPASKVQPVPGANVIQASSETVVGKPEPKPSQPQLEQTTRITTSEAFSKKKAGVEKEDSKKSTWGRLPRWVKIAIPLFVVCFCLTGIFGALRNANQQKLANKSTMEITQQLKVTSQLSQTSTLPPDSTPSTEPTAEIKIGVSTPQLPSGWQTWVAGNTYYSILAGNDRIVAGGPGGITMWNVDGTNPQKITIRNGLAGDTVLAIYPESQDLIWVGTNEGLTRVSEGGARWESFYMDSGLDSDYISAITRVEEGLLIGTQYSGQEGGGLLLFKDDKFSAIDIPSGETDGPTPGRLSYNVNALVYQPGQGLWVATWNGLGRFDGSSWSIYQEQFINQDWHISSLYLDMQNRLWISAGDGYVYLYENGAFTFIDNVSERGIYGVLAIVQGSDGRIWFAGYGGVAVYDPDAKSWKYYNAEQNNIPVNNIFSATRAPDGTLYFGTEREGLLHFVDNKFATWYMPGFLTYGQISRILKSPDGKLWFRQEYGGGFEVYDTSSQQFIQEPNFEVCCLSGWEPDGTPWFIDYDGVRIQHGLEIKHLTTEQGLPADNTTELVVTGPSEAWIGTEGGIAHIQTDQVVETYTIADGLPDNNVHFLYNGSDGSIWAGLDQGLSRRTPDGQWVNYLAGEVFSQSLGGIYDLVEDTQRNLVWVVANGDGLYRFDGQNWQSFKPDQPGVDFTSPYLQSIALLGDGSILIGFDYGGLVRFQPDTNEWQGFSVEDGLPHRNIKDIFVDVDQSVWLATSGGITRINP